MTHIVLLGDSVFDNAPYVAPGEEVVAALRRRIPSGWTATILARDGAVLAGLAEQVGLVPVEATHLVLSAGGNDGLGWSGLLGEEAKSMADALSRLAGIRSEFQRRYRAMLDRVLALSRPTAVCTIYDPRFPDQSFREVAVAALTLLNDVITREAARNGLPVLDLRILFDDEADFANPIEPSGRGSEKLAGAIPDLLEEQAFAQPRAMFFGGAQRRRG